jgi:O-antigen/teichoic acid export membrane protein
MTLWMLLAVTQPVLIGTGRQRLHMKLGVFRAVLAAAIVTTGWWRMHLSFSTEQIVFLSEQAEA